MINFYQEWKNEKDSEPKVRKPRGAFKCIVCGKRTNGLKAHMDDAHGAGTYQMFVAAQEAIKEKQRREILELMGITMKETKYD